MSGTAWRTVGEDGAILSTFLDADGRFRDFRNGDPMQEGSWDQPQEGRLCFTPEAEDRLGECWTLGKLRKNGEMRATSDTGLEIKLRQIAYVAEETGDD